MCLCWISLSCSVLKPLVGSVVSQQGADVFRAAPMEELEGDATCCVMP